MPRFDGKTTADCRKHVTNLIRRGKSVYNTVGGHYGLLYLLPWIATTDAMSSTMASPKRLGVEEAREIFAKLSESSGAHYPPPQFSIEL
jgi:hypothetical protein